MERKINYIEQLKKATSIYGSRMCSGLDPVINALHKKFSVHGIMGFYYMLEELFHYMKEQKVYPGAFKPNYGFYAVHCVGRGPTPDFTGLVVLGKVLDLIDQLFPGMIKILDNKTGDIGKSSANYAIEDFKVWNTESATISPYMGDDSMEPYLEYCGNQLKMTENRGVYILNRTSNHGANTFQTMGASEGRSLYWEVAEWIRNHAGKFPGIGAVIGAPNLKDLGNIARFYAEGVYPVASLIPGVGGQGGKADEVIKVLSDAGYDLDITRINFSSGFTHPWGEEPAPDDWKKIIVENLDNYNRLTATA